MAISKIIYKASAVATPEVWMDSTTATAQASDILAPKTAMLADGVMTEGTGTGGGGGSTEQTLTHGLTMSYHMDYKSSSSDLPSVQVSKSSSTSTYGATVITTGSGRYAYDNSGYVSGNPYPIMLPDGCSKLTVTVPNQDFKVTAIWVDTMQAASIGSDIALCVNNDDDVAWSSSVPNGDRVIDVPVSDGPNGVYINIYSGSGLVTQALLDQVTVVATIPGEGGGSVAAKDVNFIDYDGSIIASYTAQEFASLSALPANPSHTGLVAQGWNWSFANIKAYVQKYPGTKVWIGQMYTTASGDSEIDIVLDDPNFLSPWLTIAVNGTVEVDWGDGSAKDTMTGPGLTTSKYQQHVYSQTGSYTIKFHVVSGSFAFYSASSYAGVLRIVNAANNRTQSRVYSNHIQAIRIGSGASIGTYAFCSCSTLQSITIPNTVTSIGSSAFYSCYALQSITIPDDVTSIGSSAFQACYALQSIAIPDGVTSIGSSMFNTCSALQSITIPNTVTSIGSSAFNSCRALQSITIPDTVTSIGNSAFNGCNALQSITIPDGVTSIGTYAFQYCYALQSITIPDDVTSIGVGVFYSCYALQSITIHDDVTSIESSAFNSCYSIQSITIPDGVTSIGSSAFTNCYGMYEYHFLPTTPPTLASTNAFGNIMTDTVMYVPYSADHSILNAYKTETNWSTYASYMQEEPQS